jgi:hypothetical protein
VPPKVLLSSSIKRLLARFSAFRKVQGNEAKTLIQGKLQQRAGKAVEPRNHNTPQAGLSGPAATHLEQEKEGARALKPKPFL